MSLLNGLKICFVAGTLGQGGAERQLFYQLQTLKECGANPTLLYFSEQRYWQKHIEQLDIPIIELPTKVSHFGRLVKMLSVIREYSPDIVQSAHFFPNVYVSLTARYLKAKEIGAIRSDGIRDVAEAGFVGGQLSLRTPRFLAVNSKNAIKNLRCMGVSDKKLIYLPNIVDARRFSPNGELAGDDAFHILMVGRLIATKRFDVFLKVLALLNAQGSTNVIGHIVGSGPDQGHLQGLACELGLKADRVIFHGAIPDVERIYRKVDLCLHLSDGEGFPNTILEAMASGLPVIASSVGGIPEIVKDGENGFLVKSNDENEITSLTTRLIKSRDLRKIMGQKAREFIECHCALFRLPSHLENLYQRVLNV